MRPISPGCTIYCRTREVSAPGRVSARLCFVLCRVSSGNIPYSAVSGYSRDVKTINLDSRSVMLQLVKPGLVLASGE
ncbi:hypothetical protein RRG08_008224 [Elysia crispata]|uniref:Uncharacterized protein n=1 Tax=Elysia crispata TaxID=231223 RepID=A0AAE0YB67_9GAST|nr:hypothetical protein RRG08_008224 [Elysia crispata]